MYLFLLYNVAWRIPDIDRWAQSKSNSRRMLYSDFPQTFLWRCSQDARQRDRKIVSKRVETCQGWLDFTLFTYVAYLFTYRYRLWGESFQDIVKCLHANVNCNYFTQYCRTLLRKAVTSDFFIYKCSAHVDSCSLKVHKNEWRSELGGDRVWFTERQNCALRGNDRTASAAWTHNSHPIHQSLIYISYA